MAFVESAALVNFISESVYVKVWQSSTGSNACFNKDVKEIMAVLMNNYL